MLISKFRTKIRLGDHTLSSEEDCYAGVCAPRYQEFSITKVIPHQLYGKLDENDIAILILDKDARESGK